MAVLLAIYLLNMSIFFKHQIENVLLNVTMFFIITFILLPGD